jgi:hypothetical protein
MKIASLFLMLGAIAFASCSTNQNESKNLEVVQSYINAVETMDYEAMGTYLDDAYLGIGPSLGDSINKVQAIESWKANVATLYESIKYNRSRNISVTITEGDNQGEWVSNWAELTINFTAEKGTVTIMANTLYKLKDGKIIKSYTFYNEADAFRQLGYSIVNFDEL